jgi:hypothetical protein
MPQYLRNDNLDCLDFEDAAPLKPVLFQSWMDENESQARVIQTPFLLEPSGLDEVPVLTPENVSSGLLFRRS